MRLLQRLILLPFIAISASAAEGDGVVFRQQYKPGHRYHQTTSMNQEMDLNLGAQQMEQKLAMSVGLEAVVTKSGDGTDKSVKVTYDRAAVSVSAQGQKFSFDSENPGTANAGPLAGFGNVVGRSFRVIFDSNDEVTRVDDLDDTVTALAGSDPVGANMFRDLFNQESVKRMLQQSVLRSPDARPMKVGEGWPFTNDLSLPGIGKLQIKGQYTFTGMVERDGIPCAEVRAMAEVTLDPSKQGGADDEAANAVEQMNMKLEQGKLQGVLYYDPAIHFTRSLEIEQRLTLTAKVPDGTGKVLRLPMKQVIGMKLDSFAPIGAAKPKAAEPEEEQ